MQAISRQLDYRCELVNEDRMKNELLLLDLIIPL